MSFHLNILILGRAVGTPSSEMLDVDELPLKGELLALPSGRTISVENVTRMDAVSAIVAGPLARDSSKRPVISA